MSMPLNVRITQAKLLHNINTDERKQTRHLLLCSSDSVILSGRMSQKKAKTHLCLRRSLKYGLGIIALALVVYVSRIPPSSQILELVINRHLSYNQTVISNASNCSDATCFNTKINAATKVNVTKKVVLAKLNVSLAIEPSQYELSNRWDYSHYVTVGEGFKDGRRLGNQMFDIAAGVYVAALSNRTFVMEKVSNHQVIFDAFDLKLVPRISNFCPCLHFSESFALTYDKRIENFGQSKLRYMQSKTIILNGFFQSWKYVKRVESTIRTLFTFRSQVQEFAEQYLMDTKPNDWTRYTRIAVHARRGDLKLKKFVEFGFTMPTSTYFRKAMDYFIKVFDHIQFIVLCEDSSWAMSNIVKPESISLSHVNITYSVGNTAAQDLAVIAACDHVIISTGSYGWWGAYLANGTTIYYTNWPRKGSSLYSWFTAKDYFPPSWIGMGD